MSEPGPDVDPVEDEAEFSPGEAFALLGDDTRVAILEALATNRAEPVPFADLRELVGVADSGRFNYHLKKLVGRFVEKDDEGYRLTFAGQRVVGAVYEGSYARGASIEPIELDDPCPLCGGTVRLDYTDERVSIACLDCDSLRTSFGFPPGAVSTRSREDLPEALTRHVWTMLHRVAAGFCGNCSNPVAPAFEDGPEELAAFGEVAVRFDCDRCGEGMMADLSTAALTLPAVIALHHDHGVDLREASLWNLPWLVDAESEVASREPPRYAVTGTLGTETLRVVVDDGLHVVESERTPAED